ncbi:MAG: methyltransferase domain-containing protein [Burkholderiales bacterium]
MNSNDIARLAGGRGVLDIGCGRNKFPGSTGIDFAANAEADLRHDLNTYPWPCGDASFEVLLLRNVIEHLQDVVRLMEEVHRIGVPGADVVVTTPHFSSLYSWQDPTHVRHLAYDSMDYFTENTRHSNFYTSKRFRMAGRGVDFGKSFPFSLIARGLFALSPHKYEKHFAFLFPANSLWFHLQVVK